MPSCATTYSTGFEAGGNRNACTCGASSPVNDGPSTTPAIISPITGGWRSQRRTTQPKKRQAASITNICRKKIIAAEMPVWGLTPISSHLPGVGARARVFLDEIRVRRQRIHDLRHVRAMLRHVFLELAVVHAREVVVGA